MEKVQKPSNSVRNDLFDSVQSGCADSAYLSNGAPGAPSPGIKQPGCEADNSPLASGKADNVGGDTPLPTPYVFTALLLIKRRENIVFEE
jgi:hypothetical protein